MKLLAQGGELAAGAGLGEEVDFFFGEVQRGFGEHAQLDQPLQQGLDARGEGACQRAAGATGGGGGAGVDQVGHGFGLRQVELAVQKGAFGEFAGPRQPQAGQQFFSRLQAARQQQLQHDGAAMGLQLQHVFAGVGVRRGEKERQSVVDGAAVCVQKRQIGGLPRLQRSPA